MLRSTEVVNAFSLGVKLLLSLVGYLRYDILLG